MLKVKVNEVAYDFTEPPKLMELRARFKPDADLVIHNGFPSAENVAVSDGDSVVLIRKGEKPGMDELEALMSARHTPGVHGKVRSATVGIAGLGGLGSPVAVALARVGVGTLVLADYDVVEPSNLNRQQYFVDQIGRPKVSAMEENLKRINPFVRTVTHNVILDEDNIPELFGGVDVLVEALDDAGAKAMLVNVMAGKHPEIPVVCASGVAGYGPSNDIATKRFSGSYYIVGDLTSEAGAGVGLMAPRVGVAAHHQANCVLRILLGEEAAAGDPPGEGEVR